MDDDKKADTDTWYVLADGTHAHPADVESGEDGVLKSKAGVPVALRENGLPRTSGVAVKSGRKAARAGGEGSRSTDTKAMKPGDQQGSYATRESKAQ